MIPGVEGGVTIHYPSRQRMSIFDAAMRYKKDNVPLVVFAGKEYGSGSSRDWAAKGPNLLGVRAVICQSFERIHRSNLIGMGVLPLCFEEGTSWQTLGLKGDEQVTIRGLHGEIKPRQRMIAEIVASDGALKRVPLTCRIDTLDELEYFRHGGHFALRAAPARGVICPGGRACSQGGMTLGRNTLISAAFAHPGGGKATDKQKEPDQTGKNRQHADASHHACLADAQTQPVVALEGIARTNGENAGEVDGAAILHSHNVAAGRSGQRCQRLP